MISSVDVRTEQRTAAVATPSLNEMFDTWFDVVPADTPDLLKQVYRLRYQVYCTENQFENPREHPNGMEEDEFDFRSVHTLLLDRTNRAAAGTARLIFPSWNNGCDSGLPVQNVTGRQLLPGNPAEISRFAISKAYRKESALLLNAPEEVLTERRLLMSCITLGLMKGLVSASVQHGVTDLYAVMEPALLRLLSRFAIYFRPFGPLVDYHGMRQPCYVPLDSLLDRAYKERPDVWEVITEEGRYRCSADTARVHCC